jgi:hypothetical protein
MHGRLFSETTPVWSNGCDVSEFSAAPIAVHLKQYSENPTLCVVKTTFLSGWACDAAARQEREL